MLFLRTHEVLAIHARAIEEFGGLHGVLDAGALEAALTALQRLAIRVDAEDTGGIHGRTLLVDAGSGRMEVRALRVTVKVL